MPFTLNVDGVSQGLGSVTFFGSWNGADFSCGPGSTWFQWGYQAFSFLTPVNGPLNSSSGSWGATEGIDADRDAKVRAIGQDCNGQKQSGNAQFKTLAFPGAFLAGLTPFNVTTNSAQCSGQINPNTRESLCQVTIEFRVFGTSVWTETAAVATNLQGSSAIGLGGTLTGLAANTTYEARYRATRNTANDQVFFSAIGIFTTQSDSPPKTIVVPSPMQGQGLMQIPSVNAAKTIVTPCMQGSGTMNVPPLIESPELTTRVEVDVFVASRVRLNVFV